jgi:hypothetical protein
VSNAPSWLTVTSSANAAGTQDVSLTALPNPGALPRSGTLTIAGQIFTVSEAGAPCTFNLAASSATIAGDGAANQTLSFSAGQPGCTITAVSYANWITANAVLNGTAGTLTYSVAANPGGTARSGTIQVGDQVFTINQQPSTSACTYSLNSHGAAFGQSGGNASFLGSAAIGCGAPQPGTNLPSMITLQPTAGPVNQIFTQPYAVTFFSSVANAIRKATITFGGQIFTVKQTSW